MRINILLLIFVCVYSLCVDAYIYYTIKRGKKEKRNIGRIIYLVSTILCYILLSVVIIFPKRSLDSNIVPIMWMLYSYATIYIAKSLYLIFSVIGRIPCLFKKQSIPLGKYLGLPIGIFILFLMWWGALVTKNEIDINRVEIVSSKLPASFDGYRIVQFSDAHVGTWGDDTLFISKVVTTINSLNPDLVVFTGDIVNRSTDEVLPFVKILSRLKAKDGVFSILGNHDYGDYIEWENEADHIANNQKLCEIERNMNWHLLNNSYVFIRKENDSIAIIGVENVGDPPFKIYGDLKVAYPHNKDGRIEDNNFKILLSHNPVHWTQEVIPTTDIDLTLSGHTHAMQVMISLGGKNWSPAKWRYPLWGGLYVSEDNTQNLYVNIGCGEVGMPFRIGAIPEITEITLKRQ